MDGQNDDDPIKQIPITDLKIDPTPEDLIDSPAMEPYNTWRVASALKWAFADFENLNVVADRRTLSQEDLDTLVDLLRVRPLQFCLFLAALFGEEQMEKMMYSSVQQVKTIRANRRKSLGREPELGED